MIYLNFIFPCCRIISNKLCKCTIRLRAAKPFFDVWTNVNTEANAYNGGTTEKKGDVIHGCSSERIRSSYCFSSGNYLNTEKSYTCLWNDCWCINRRPCRRGKYRRHGQFDDRGS